MTPLPKTKAFRSQKYLRWVAGFPCEVCGCPNVEGILENMPMHQRILGHGGTALKPPDNEVLPGCRTCHDLEQQKGYLFLWQTRSKYRFINSHEELKNHIRERCEYYFEKWRSQ